MRTKIVFCLIFQIIAFNICFSQNSGTNQLNRDRLVQFSTYDALYQGVFEGTVKYKDFVQYGDFGIGTFDGLDGEMIMLDNIIYQIPASGKVKQISDLSVTTPFLMLTFFDIDKELKLAENLKYADLQAKGDSMLPSKNVMYAIRIDGIFKKMKTRSVPKQSRPYPKLAEIVKTQPVFEFENIEGTLVGYWTPQFLKGTGFPGFHLHFISKDRKSGGHVLDFTVSEAILKLDKTNDFELIIPDNEDFYKANFGQ
jgi:acetolactate decarboxylase